MKSVKKAWGIFSPRTVFDVEYLWKCACILEREREFLRVILLLRVSRPYPWPRYSWNKISLSSWMSVCCKVTPSLRWRPPPPRGRRGRPECRADTRGWCSPSTGPPRSGSEPPRHWRDVATGTEGGSGSYQSTMYHVLDRAYYGNYENHVVITHFRIEAVTKITGLVVIFSLHNSCHNIVCQQHRTSSPAKWPTWRWRQSVERGDLVWSEVWCRVRPSFLVIICRAAVPGWTPSLHYITARISHVTRHSHNIFLDKLAAALLPSLATASSGLPSNLPLVLLYLMLTGIFLVSLIQDTERGGRVAACTNWQCIPSWRQSLLFYSVWRWFLPYQSQWRQWKFTSIPPHYCSIWVFDVQ